LIAKPGEASLLGLQQATTSRAPACLGCRKESSQTSFARFAPQSRDLLTHTHTPHPPPSHIKNLYFSSG